MSKKYKLSLQAQSDYEEILVYIAVDNLAAAKRVRTKLQEAFVALAQNPYIGHRREDLTNQPFRFWNVYSYQIIYDSESSPLSIIRILSGFRDINTLLSDEYDD